MEHNRGVSKPRFGNANRHPRHEMNCSRVSKPQVWILDDNTALPFEGIVMTAEQF